MSRINSREKGNRAERFVLRVLKNWWPIEHAKEWRRAGMGFVGPDIIPPTNFPWTVEVKDWEEARTEWFFFPTAYLRKWWQQAKFNCTIQPGRPLLIVKSESKWYVLFDELLDTIMLREFDTLAIIREGDLKLFVTPLDTFLYVHEPHIQELSNHENIRGREEAENGRSKGEVRSRVKKLATKKTQGDS